MFKALYDRLRGHATPLQHEQICIDAWRETLSAKAQLILASQLSATRLTQRQAAGAKLCFYYSADGNYPLFARTEPDLHVATVILGAGSTAKEMKARVFMHRGKFFSLEFPKRPARFAQQHQMNLASLYVRSVTTHIDLG